jgi:glutamyl-tRNA reductase
MVAHAMSRRSEPLLILDIALPRDVEPEAATVPGVRLYDLDDLDRVVTGTLERRRSAVEHAESIIDSGVDEFWAWFRARGVVPVIRELRGRAEELRQRELRRARRQLRNLTESEFEAVDGLTRQLLAKILHVPTSRLRDAAAEGRDEELLDAARYLFSIDDSPDDGEDA